MFEVKDSKGLKIWFITSVKKRLLSKNTQTRRKISLFTHFSQKDVSVLGENSWCTPLEYFYISGGKKKLLVKWFPDFLEQTSLNSPFSPSLWGPPIPIPPPSLSQQVHLLTYILPSKHQLSPQFVFFSPPKGAGGPGSQWRWGQGNSEHRTAGTCSSPGLGWVFEVGAEWGHGTAPTANHSQPQSHSSLDKWRHEKQQEGGSWAIKTPQPTFLL